ncbi:13647_t:CDS:2 [Gigaspora rosea]|nr:13647_t:CDS:2 [Gigaspora rosea]
MASSLSELETMNTVNTNNIRQKKRKIKESDPNTAYCKICKINLEETGKAAYAVHLTTDLWTAKSRDGYLGVTTICEIISDELSKIIEDWDLSSKVFVVATDNRINILKSTDLLSNKYNNQINYQSCTAHTLQLLVLEGLKQYKPFHRQIKSLQAFFRLPKQEQSLRAMQQKNS